MYIQDKDIEAVRSRTNILEIIQEHLTLKKMGRNYVGSCPFHVEKTPSFTVNSEKQIFKCFGCGVGGNVFSFLMKKEGITFPESVQECATRIGYKLKIKKSSVKVDNKKLILYEINQFAAQYYHRVLNSARGSGARDYLKKRNIKSSTVSLFSLGFARDGWENLKTELMKENYKISDAIDSGLIIKKSEKQSYDRFRNRIIFPILDDMGRYCGIGGRVMDRAEPKYLNSPQSDIYSKGTILYGFYQAKKHIQKTNAILITEGYMDAITAHQHGFSQTVATLGTALTEDHVRMIKRFTNRIYLIFDPDEAGMSATLRGIEHAFKMDLKVRVVIMPDNLDPADFLISRGKDEFRKCLKDASDLIEFILKKEFQSANFDSLSAKLEYVRRVKRFVHSVKDRSERAYYIQKISDIAGLENELIRREIRGTGEEISVTKRGTEDIPDIERDFLHLLLSQKDKPEFRNTIIPFLKNAKWNLENLMTSDIYSEIFKQIKPIYTRDITSSQCIDRLNDEVKKVFIDLEFQEGEHSSPVKEFKDYLLKLSDKYYKYRQQQLRKQIVQTPDPGTKRNLLIKSTDLVNKQQELRKNLIITSQRG